MAYKPEQEIILDTKLDSTFAHYVVHFLKITSPKIKRAMPQAKVSARLTNQAETDALNLATDRSHSLKLGRYITRLDKTSIDAGNTASVLITPRLLTVENASGWRKDTQGYYADHFGLGVVSAVKIARDLGSYYDGVEKIRRTAEAVGFCVWHTLGHLNGLVDQAANQVTAGNHCGNLCVMKKVDTSMAINEYLESFDNLSNLFCRPCVADLRADN